MNKNIKKLIIIIVFLIVVVGLAYLIFYMFFKPPISVEPSDEIPLEDIDLGGLPTTKEGQPRIVSPINVNQELPSVSQIPEDKEISEVARGDYTNVGQLSDIRVTSPNSTPSGGFNYFNDSEGRFYSMGTDGSVKKLSDQRFFSVEKVTWSPGSDKAVLEYPDGANILYDFNQDKQYSLPKELQDFAFSKNGQSIAAEAIGPREENNWIITANPDGSNIQFIERLGSESNNVDINWSPNNQMVATFRKNISADNQEIIFIGRHEENFKSLITYGRGFEGQWTPDSQKLLYSVFRADNGFKPTLWLTDASGEQIGLNNNNLGLETWTYKCTVSADSSFAYCGVPESLPDGSGIFPDLAKETIDNFYRVNLLTGQTSLLAQPVGDKLSYSVKDIFLAPDESTLYFQDAGNGSLYSIKLK